MGIHPHLLNAQEIASGDLSKYNVIVLGIRAYAARTELVANNGRLLDYVRNGGNLVVQYQSGEYDHNFGPYPYSLGRSPEKVVDETAPVTLLAPKDPLLNCRTRSRPPILAAGWKSAVIRSCKAGTRGIPR